MSVPPLKLPFLTQESVTQVSRALGEPDWLAAERHDAFGRVTELPAEANQLFTPYLDLRAARFVDITPYLDSATAPGLTGELPRGAAAYLHVRENAVVAGRLHRSHRLSSQKPGTIREPVQRRLSKSTRHRPDTNGRNRTARSPEMIARTPGPRPWGRE